MAGIRIQTKGGFIPEYNESHYWAEARAGWFLTYPRHK